MFEKMRHVALLWLKDRDPLKIARNAGVEFDRHAFYFTSLGREIMVSYPEFQITPQLSPWHELLILHYLHLADGTPLSGNPIAFAQQPGGMVRGGKFDRKVEQILQSVDLNSLKRNCRRLGGMEVDSNADYCVVLPFLPRYPLTLKFWAADEDFPASVRLMPDGSGAHYFTVEDSVTAGELILEELQRR